MSVLGISFRSLFRYARSGHEFSKERSARYLITRFSTLSKQKAPTSNLDIHGTIPEGGEGIEEGQFAMLQRTFTPSDIMNFGNLIVDLNPIHDSTKMKDKQIVHGMLSASLFSSMFGTLIPRCIYKSQSLQFISPVHCNEKVIGIIEVQNIKQIRSKGCLVRCSTHVYKNFGGDINAETNMKKHTKINDDVIVCVSGEAVVWIPRQGLPK